MISKAGFNKVLKYSLSAATIGAPAAYMIHFHNKFYTKPENKIKMLNKQLGFWGGMSAGVYLIHRNLAKFRKNKAFFAASLAFMTFAPWLGVRMAKLVNRIIYPAKKEITASNQYKYSLNKDFDVFIKSIHSNKS